MWRLVVVAIVTSAGTASAQSFFSSSPGALSKSHAALDAQAHCNDCHVNGTRAISPDRCLGCHDHQDLAVRIKKGEGFHAASPVKGKPCESCHDEHRGPKFDLMGWNAVGGEAGFRPRHGELATWSLAGKHATTDCAECHTTTNKQGLRVYMGVDRRCGGAGCHGNDQPHKLQRPALLDCSRCHTESVWRPAKDPMRFDHDDRDQAAMPLLGAHVGQACDKCHPNDIFNLPFVKPAACNNSGCHAPKHPPNHLFDQRDCDWCHSPTFMTFRMQTRLALTFFDHDGHTRFDLGGPQARHSKLSCYACHTAQLAQRRPQMACETCHGKDNRHRDRFSAFGAPPRCATCHVPIGFATVRFDHARNTGYDLTAKHGQTTCRGCHRGSTPADFERFASGADCKSCHQHATAHASPNKPRGPWQSTQCLKCHSRPGDRKMRNQAELEREWHGSTSDFPLVKGHKGLARSCAKCHTDRGGIKTTTFDEESPECGDRCHQDSLHRGSLGKRCTPCHVSGEWAALKFDHDMPVFPDGTPGFALRGEHRNNSCEACHGEARQFKGTPRACSAGGCHGEDDAHKGRLGTECGKCHTEAGDNLFNHNTMSAFHLDGKHLQVKCADCHPSVTFKPRPTTCFGCHPEPAVHKGQYGTGCELCHTTRTWDDIKPLHDVGDFSLKGMHDNVACERCHRDSRPLAGSGNLCINCHRQDDIHNNSLSPRCGDCHTQWSFTPARFDHMRVGCSLTGLHRTIACFDCHTNGNFAAITAQCGGCHRDDALRHAARQPPGAMYPHQGYVDCAGCHNANTWLGAPAAASGRESVCR